ncbi:ATP-binding cassette domain-containing protein [Spiroplasma endosymbiont of Othius punctulatus]|uniref:ATP-binding cassette domain-containing protein n=1 Tax=Spiroplasma endosymbiont of Othius punctulatus TaxID=3066289 RepID=UPI0030CF8C7C
MSITVKNLKIKYDNKNIVDNVSFVVESGEVLTILGPSGSGKTTLLDSIAGLKQPTSGQIHFKNFDVTRTSPQRRNVGYVFQDYALYPHLSVSKNIGLPLIESKSLHNRIKTKNINIKRNINLLNNSGNLKELYEYQKNICFQLEKQIREINERYFSDDINITKKLTEEVEAIVNAKISRDDETLFSRMTSTLFDQVRVFYFDEYVKTFEEVKAQILNLKNKEIDKTIKTIIQSIWKTFDYEWVVKYKYLSSKNKKSVKSQLDLFNSEIHHVAKDKSKLDECKKITSKECLDDMIELIRNAFKIEIAETKTIISHMIYTFESDFQDYKNTLSLSLEPTIYTVEEFNNENELLKSKLKNSKEVMKKMISDVAAKVDITELLEKKPNQLSWGQQQRVAIARAIVKVPDVLLMDEALSHLDYQLKSITRRWFKEFQREMKITTIAVTHDQSEAMSMSDKIAVLNNGKIIQFGTPREIYDNPVNKFVAEFVGSPQTNIIAVTVSESKFKIQDIEFKTKVNGEVFIGIRPEDVILGNKFKGQVSLIEDMGKNKNVSIKFDNTTIIGVFDSTCEFEIGQEIKFDFKNKKMLIFESEDDQKLIEVI